MYFIKKINDTNQNNDHYYVYTKFNHIIYNENSLIEEYSVVLKINNYFWDGISSFFFFFLQTSVHWIAVSVQLCFLGRINLINKHPH